jgi:hypothetical protein
MNELQEEVEQRRQYHYLNDVLAISTIQNFLSQEELKSLKLELWNDIAFSLEKGIDEGVANSKERLYTFLKDMTTEMSGYVYKGFMLVPQCWSPG